MRVLLSTIGSRGDVQPLLALALQLRALGQEPRLCVPPDFRQWLEGLGFAVTPIGPELRLLTAARPQANARPSPEQLRSMAEGTVAAQFATLPIAAQGCDVIVAATALQLAARSVAEQMSIPHVFVAFCPTVLPSSLHAPISFGLRGDPAAPATVSNQQLWQQDATRWNSMWLRLRQHARAH